MKYPPPITLTGDPEERDYKSPKFTMGSLSTVTLYHDYICPWCYVGFFQAQRLTELYGLQFDWRGAELLPPGMEFNPPPPKPVDPTVPPAPPSRFDKFAIAEGIPLPSPRPTFVRSHRALLGQEFANRNGGLSATVAYNEAVYRGYWEQRVDISDLNVLSGFAADAQLDAAAFREAVENEADVDLIVPYDDDAYAVGIRHLPLYLFGAEELLAEAPYDSLAAATENFLVRSERYRK